jgi:membrane associated rhomboid family serine protease
VSDGRADAASDVVLRVAPRKQIADDWALVLAAEGLAPRVWRADEGYAVGVAPAEREQALSAIDDYERENAARHDEPDTAAPLAHPLALRTGLGISAGLLLFFLHTGARRPGVSWFERGSAEAERILSGEFWRLATALTLHADLGHVAANAVVGAVFVTAVCRWLGPGVGIALVLLTGIGGNALNAWVQGPGHASVGASTAVFGAVGLLGGLGVSRWRRRGARGRRQWIPVAAAIGLLGMLGTAGERTDLWAHLWGLAVGAGLGVPLGFGVTRLPTALIQALAGCAAVAALAASWALALG